MIEMFLTSAAVTLFLCVVWAAMLLAAPPPVALFLSFPAFWAGVLAGKAVRSLKSRLGKRSPCSKAAAKARIFPDLIYRRSAT